MKDEKIIIFITATILNISAVTANTATILIETYPEIDKMGDFCYWDIPPVDSVMLMQA